MDVSGQFPMNKHETLRNFVRFGMYFNGKLCLKNIDFLRNYNIVHLLKISRNYFHPPNFLEKKLTIIISIIFLCTFSKMFYLIEIVILLAKI